MANELFGSTSPNPLALIPRSSPPIRRTDQLARDIWNHGQSGVLISGDPGSGKSVFARNVFRSLVRENNSAVFLIDPAGDLAKQARRDCIAMGRSVMNRTQYFAYGDPSTIVPLSALHVPRNTDEFTYGASLSYRVSHCAHLLISAWGADSFDGTPTLHKWTMTFLKSLALMGLPMAEVKHFLNPGSDMYNQLATHVPDLFAQLQLGLLAELKPKEQVEQIQSTANRFIGFFDNPICEAILGVADPAQCFDVHQAIDERQIVIVDLESAGLLRDEDQKIIANLFLAEIFHDIFSRPQADRRNVAIICDELPVFTPSFKMLETLMRLGRKTLARFFGICQGTQAFPDGIDSPLLQAMIGGTGMKAIFRHTNPRDTAFFGELLATPLIDPLLEKFRYTEQEQYLAGHELRELVDRSFSDSSGATRGGSEGGGTDHGNTESSDVSEGNTVTNTDTRNRNATHTSNDSHHMTPEMQMIGNAYSNATALLAGEAHATGDANSRTTRNGTSTSVTEKRSWQTQWTSTTNRTEGTTIKQQLVPIHLWKETLRMIEFFTREEQIGMMGTHIARQQNGQCFLYISARGVAQAQIPLPRDPFLGARRTATRRIEAFMQQLHQLPYYHTQADLLTYRRELIPMVLNELRNLAQTSPALPVAADTPNTIDLRDTNIRI